MALSLLEARPSLRRAVPIEIPCSSNASLDRWPVALFDVFFCAMSPMTYVRALTKTNDPLDAPRLWKLPGWALRFILGSVIVAFVVGFFIGYLAR